MRDRFRAAITESLLAEAEAARVLAMKENQPSAAIAAIAAKGKLAGIWVERSEQTNKTGDLSQYSDAELAAVIRSGLPKEETSKLN